MRQPALFLVPVFLMSLAILLLPDIAVAQNQTAGEAYPDCSDCDFCPGDPDRIAFFDDHQDDVLWVAQNCYTGGCGIPCTAGLADEERISVDELAIQIPEMKIGDVLELTDSADYLEFLPERNAVLVRGCNDESIAAVLPVAATRPVNLAARPEAF